MQLTADALYGQIPSPSGVPVTPTPAAATPATTPPAGTAGPARQQAAMADRRPLMLLVAIAGGVVLLARLSVRFEVSAR